MEKQRSLRRFFTERNIILLMRWWMAGAVYFFIGWGTNLGSQTTQIDLVTTLGIVLGLTNLFFINPTIRMMFVDVMPNQMPKRKRAMQRVSDYLLEFLKCIAIVFIITLIYAYINQIVISLLDLPETAVPITVEPIFFGVFYVLIFLLFQAIVNFVKRLFQKTPKDG